MFDELDDVAGSITSEEAFGVLRDLERNTPEEIRRQRAHFRLAIKAAVILQPGNASDLLEMKVKGVTGDISAGGCSALFPIPIHVGDVYRLTFDRKSLDLPLTFARCVRCRLVREDAFEAGFAFFSPISLPERTAGRMESSLIS
jgi:c-di-GMP-binding flagellar brake protein YcgR